MSKEQKNYISLIFAFIMTIIDFYNSDVEANPLILSEALLVVIIIYYIVARFSIFLIESVRKIFKGN